MIQSDNSLLLTNVTYADHGTYTCSAVSVLGNVSASAYLTVQGECSLLNALIKAQWDIGRTRNAVSKTSRMQIFPRHFRVLPNLQK